MQTNYKPLGEYIQPVDERNTSLEDLPLVGLSISKQFIKSVANIIGTDLSNYKTIKRNQFACSLMQVSRDGKIPIAMYSEKKAIMSPAYPIFKVIDEELLMPEFLMMWFERSEFDRQASYYAVGGVRGNLPWEDFLELKLPVPPIEKQKEIVAEYNTIQNRIDLNNQLIQKLEETAQAIYREWFVNGIDLENLPEGWRVGKLEDIAELISRGITPSYSENEGVIILNQKCVRNNSVDFEFSRRNNENDKKVPYKKILKQFDILVNSTGDGTLGRVGIVKEIRFPMTVDSHITILRTNSQNNPIYVWGNISSRSEEISNLAEGSTGQTELSQSMFSELPILIPDKVMQEKFASIITKEIKYSYLLERENQKLTELKELLLSRLATIEK